MDIHITEEQAAAAFTAWERDFREDPEKFMSVTEARNHELLSYGQACAACFLSYVETLKSPQS